MRAPIVMVDHSEREISNAQWMVAFALKNRHGKTTLYADPRMPGYFGADGQRVSTESSLFIMLNSYQAIAASGSTTPKTTIFKRRMGSFPAAVQHRFGRRIDSDSS